jgi:hypothetical protein
MPYYNAMTQQNPLWGGIAAAVFAVVVVAFLGGCLFVVVTVDGYQLSKTGDYIGVMGYVGFVCAFVALPMSILAAIIVGAPILTVWQRRGYTSIVAYLLAGILMSVIVALVLSVARRILSDFLWGDDDYWLALAIVAVAGPVAALTVRAVAFHKQSSSGKRNGG